MPAGSVAMISDHSIKTQMKPHSLQRISRVACGAAFLLPAVALAQSSITLYGRIDTSLEYTNFGPNHVVRMGTGNLFATEWGMKGIEDLGGGYAAIFKLENGFNSANGAFSNNGAMFGREAWVGLTSPYGGMQLGELYTILHTVLVTYALPGYGAGLEWGNATNNFVGPAYLRVHNAVRLTSAQWNGFMLRAIAARGANGANGQPATLGDSYGAGLNYARGPVSFDVAWMEQKFSPVAAASLNTESPTAQGNYLVAGASYDFGWAKLAGLYLRHRGGPDVQTAVDSLSAYPHHDVYEIDATVPLGRAKLLASYGHYRKTGDSDGNADSYALRLDYPLSKRTVLYTGAAMVRNGSQATFTINGAGGGGVAVAKAGATASSLVAGMLVSF